MSMALLLIGSVLIFSVCLDSFMTIMAIRRGGPLTRFWTSRVWHLLLRLNRRFDLHYAMSFVGPLFTLTTIMLWYFIMVAGFFLVFISSSEAVVHNLTRLEASLPERLYYVTTTLSSIGYGDLVPSGFPWTLGASLGTLAATLVLTTAISYLMPVLTAGVQRRTLAREIHAVGTSPQEIVKHSWTSSNVRHIDSYWVDIASTISEHTQRHFAYPVLQYYHSTAVDHSSAVTILNLADAIFLVGSVKDRQEILPSGVIRILEHGLYDYAMLTDWVSILNEDADSSRLAMPARDDLTQLGLTPVSEDEFERRRLEYKPLRDRIYRLCLEDGWSDEEMAEYRYASESNARARQSESGFPD